MPGPTKADLEAELAKLRRQNRALGQRADRAEAALGASEARAETLARELGESQERQTATSEILSVIASSPTEVQPVFDAIVRRATRLCEASFGALGRYEGGVISAGASHGLTTEELEAMDRAWPIPASRATLGGRAIADRAVVQVDDVQKDTEWEEAERLRYHNVPGVTRPAGFRSGLAVPLLKGGEPIGVLVMWRREVRPFVDHHIELVKTFADQAVIAIENVRLFTELEARHADLTEALEQETATAAILQVISSSPTDVQPVLDAVAESAARLCDAQDSLIHRVDGETMRLMAHWGGVKYGATSDVRPVSPRTHSGRAILERRVIHME